MKDQWQREAVDRQAQGATRVFVEREKLESDDSEAWSCKWD
jgi:hypothetical protein